MEAAMSQYPHKNNTQFNVTWKAFFLNPSVPAEGVPLKEYLENKYGKARLEASSKHLKEMGQQNGINFRDDRKIVLTLDSHRLVELAKKQGKQDQCIEALFHAYFEECKDINNRSVLENIGNNIGLTGVGEYLESGEGVEEIKKQVNEAQQRRIHGVPYFVVSSPGKKQRLAFSGAQPAEVFLEAFEELE